MTEVTGVEREPASGTVDRSRSHGPGRALRPFTHGPLPVVLFLGLMVTAWVFADPPGYVHDEPAHYTKALGVGTGQWTGKPGRYPVGPGFGPLQLQWINRAARVMEIPPNMAPDSFACSIFQPRKSASCLYDLRPPKEAVPRLTYVGTYEPFLYLPPGLVMSRAHHAVTALRLGRVVSAAIALALLALAVLLLHVPDEPAFPLLGLLAAVTPMVVFLVSGLSPVGPEIAAQLCFGAALIRLSRPLSHGPLVWVAAGASGVVLAMSRSLGPFFVAFDLVVLSLLSGPAQLWRVARAAGRVAGFAVVAIVAGIAANAAWGMTVQAHPPVHLASVLSQVGQSVGDVPEVLRQAVGSFGWADVNMPRVAYVAWGTVVSSLVLAAVVVGGRQGRLAVVAALGGAFTGTVAIAAAVIHQTHFPMYGRYALPLWVLVPMVAGEVVYRNRLALPMLVQRGFLLGVPVVGAAVHFTGFFSMARQYAVGAYGPVFFLGRSEWSPPLGWRTWFVLVAAAVVLLVTYGLAAARRYDGRAAGA